MPPPTPERRPTLSDVAARAGVSTALVSIVIRGAPGASDATRDRVRRVADELGYRPDLRARLLRSARSRLLGVVFDVDSDFHGDLVGGLYAAAEAAGYELALSAVTPGRDEERAVTGLLHDRCEALVLLGPQLPAARLAELAGGMPVVVVARNVRAAPVDVVRTADRLGIHEAVDHLVGLGHRRIAHVDGGRAAGAAERRRAFREALRGHGLDGARVLPGGPGEEDGARAVRRLLAEDALPTAIAAFNDRCAVGVLDVLTRAGIPVPGAVSVIGYDDSRLARLSAIDLTTVAQDAAAITTLAVRRAVDRLDGGTVGAREQVVPPRLVVRGSTAPPLPGVAEGEGRRDARPPTGRAGREPVELVAD